MKLEKQIEAQLIEKLRDLKYAYRPDIRDRAALEANFRRHFERLNHVALSDAEFSRLRDSVITEDTFAAARTLRERNTFKRDDDTPLQFILLHAGDWSANEFEVIRQLRANTESSSHRYDVVLLLNGLPVVQIELKALQITPKKAVEQIVAYKNDPGNGYTNSLLCFIQLFIVSNETRTYYFSNNHREHFSFHAGERFLPIYEDAYEDNRKISNLYEFADHFLPKHTLSQLISRYMVLVASEQKLVVMRPYQIYAVRAILDCIEQNRGNGYIWHTTGSGKTLTSFKAATLLKDNPEIEKCLFVVDRKDLDRQTRLEFNKFQEGCVEENTNTGSLVRRLTSSDYKDKVIVTTIQKLGLALDEGSKRNREKKRRGELTYRQRLEVLRDKRMAIIFDECHRSQFGDYHDEIKRFFPRAQLFGFTGTPIFEENAAYRQVDGTVGTYRTTADVFQQLLHAYTITSAIEDGNVLRFHIDYFKPSDEKKALKAGSRAHKRKIVEAILSKHDAATCHRRYNAIFATASINDAIDYYGLFRTLQKGSGDPLNVACVFSPPAEGNRDVRQLQEDLPQEQADNRKDPQRKKEALSAIIGEYNDAYGTSHSVNEFDLYYQDIQQRMKDQQYTNAEFPHRKKIDLVIVVDMLLTGFDSKYLNTLYVDKSLKQHGLIQAFSRTNRILNPTKPYGNIVDFRGQEAEVDEAIRLFSGEESPEKVKKIWLVKPADAMIRELEAAMADLSGFLASQGLPCKPEATGNLKGDLARVGFIDRFKRVQRLKTQLDQYTDIGEEQSAAIDALLPEDTLRAFRGAYMDIAQRLKDQQDRQAGLAAPELEQLDFEFVLFSSAIIDYDYIMALLSQYTQAPRSQKARMTKEDLIALIGSTSNLLEERREIEAYLDTLEAGKAMDEAAVREGYEAFKAARTRGELDALAAEQGISPEALRGFVDRILGRMIFDGEALSDLLAPLGLSWRERTKKELALMEALIPLLKKMAGGREIVGLKAYE